MKQKQHQQNEQAIVVFIRLPIRKLTLPARSIDRSIDLTISSRFFIYFFCIRHLYKHTHTVVFFLQFHFSVPSSCSQIALPQIISTVQRLKKMYTIFTCVCVRRECMVIFCSFLQYSFVGYTTIEFVLIDSKPMCVYLVRYTNYRWKKLNKFAVSNIMRVCTTVYVRTYERVGEREWEGKADNLRMGKWIDWRQCTKASLIEHTKLIS